MLEDIEKREKGGVTMSKKGGVMDKMPIIYMSAEGERIRISDCRGRSLSALPNFGSECECHHKPSINDEFETTITMDAELIKLFIAEELRKKAAPPCGWIYKLGHGV